MSCWDPCSARPLDGMMQTVEQGALDPMDSRQTDDESWRAFFLNVSSNRYLAKSVLLATHQSIQLLEESATISPRTARGKYAELTSLLTTDASEAFNVAYWTYETEASTGPKGLVATLGVARHSVGVQDQRLTEQVNAHYLRWRELLPLVRSLKEIRNTAIHDMAKEADPSWIIYVSACMLRFSYLSAAPRNDELIIDEVRRLSFRLINKALNASSVDSDQPNDDFERIERRLLSIESALTALAEAKENWEPRKASSDVEIDDVLEEPHNVAEAQEFLTEAMLKTQLQKLRDNIKQTLQMSDNYSPSDNLLQAAIINEIISKKLSSIDEILTLPDVAWRVKDRRALIEQQLELHRADIDSMLRRTAWDPQED